MVKAAGSFLVILTTTLLGMMKASDLRGQYAQMEYIRTLLLRLKSELCYGRSPLGDIFMRMGERSREPYRVWLLSMSRRMRRRNGGTFAEIWEEGVRTELAGSGLPEEELIRLAGLGRELGDADAGHQAEVLEVFLADLAGTMEEVREGLKNRIRLCHCLGVMSGMLIVTLLL